ncbi:MAG: DUF2804 domain-containing protein [Deltaproteobacteria bacterium]|nr:DUF2804 domain-containing protein [Deltaproteobacteria bacterium]
MQERELSEPVDLCLPDGRLNPDAVGWSRQPLHRCNLSGPWGRQKRWDYWCVTAPTHLLSLTIADFDYLGLASALFLDLETGERVEKAATVPFARGFSQPDEVAGADITVQAFGLSIEIREEAETTRLRVRSKALEADVAVAKPPGHETLSVVVPWGERRFQYTSKHNTRPAEGSVTTAGKEYRFGGDSPAFGCLDYGRGVWPYRTVWNWASASGVQGDRTIGLQFGGKWTDGTGSTENGLCIDGRLHKISEDVAFEYDRRAFIDPWALRSERVDLQFTPWRLQRMRVPALVVSTNLHLCFGYFDGKVQADDGTWVPIEHLLGWAEEMIARW